MSLTDHDLRSIRELTVEPAVRPLSEKMDYLIASMERQNAEQDGRIQAHDARIAKLEENQKRALIGFGMWVTALSLTFNIVWAKVKLLLGWAKP